MTVHIPVLPAEVVDLLSPMPGDTIVDGTLGGGGHAALLAERVGETGRVIGLDRDAAAAASTGERLAGLPVEAHHANYADLPEVLAGLGVEKVNGILLDLGLSSDQLDDEHRGFSFDCEGTLDLRFDVSRGEPAYRLLNRLSAEHLADLIYNYGEEKLSRRIARKIVEERRREPIETSRRLSDVIRRAVGRQYEKRINPATRTFQALRIAVNDELRWVDDALRRLPDCLAPGGRFAVISFHSLEDRRVKQAFRGDDRLRIITKNAVRPGDEELASNPRSRSSRLRVAERVGSDQ